MSYYLILRGPLGSGKSTLARQLASILKARYFEVDRILDAHGLTKDTEAGYISQKSFIKANEIIAPPAKKFLEKGTPVIFDGNFYWRTQLDDLIRRLRYPHQVFTLKVPLALCIERDRLRAKAHGQEAVRAVYRKSTEFDYGIAVEATKPVEKVVQEILGYGDSHWPGEETEEERTFPEMRRSQREKGRFSPYKAGRERKSRT